ncbi:MAG: HNH endonuclease [Thiovulaceae bacterium]|nr:HNH endonuclease [Sulfurimonadaceae bacterium]
MTDSQLEFFDATTGAFSEVTRREATGDKSVTVDQYEKQVLYELYPSDSFTRAGGALPDGIPAEKLFNIIDMQNMSSNQHNLSIKYPKIEGNELRLYFKTGTGFYPDRKKVWFIFQREGEAIPYIGEMDSEEWNKLDKEYKQQKKYDFDYSLDEEDGEYQKAIASPKTQEKGKTIEVTTHKRDAALAARSIKNSGYKCQYDESHKSFISAVTGEQYMEVHHLIPISRTPEFEHSLDVEANLIVLCPNCHRTIHYGSENIKLELLNHFFNDRKEELEQSGIPVDIGNLKRFYGINN